jgi:hypothetical protein
MAAPRRRNSRWFGALALTRRFTHEQRTSKPYRITKRSRRAACTTKQLSRPTDGASVIRDRFFLLAALLMSSDLVWSIGASGLFHNSIGDTYLLLQPQVLLLPAVLIVLIFSPRGAATSRQFLMICYVFMFIGGYEFVATAIDGAFTQLAGQQFYFGFVYPSLTLIAVAAASPAVRAAFFRAFYAGYAVYLAIVLFIFVITPTFWIQLASQGLGGALIAYRYASDDSLVHLVLGNFNKQSNYLVITLLLGPVLLGLSPATRAGGENRGFDAMVYRVFSTLALFFLFVMFSRAAILLLPLVLYINRRYMWFLSGVKVYGFAALCILLAVALAEHMSVIFDYLFRSQFIDQTEASGFIGTFQQRLDQWEDIASLLGEWEIWLHGLGVGTYGQSFGGTPAAGTHNLFLDHLLASGIVSAALVAALFLIGIIVAATRRNLRIGAAFVMLLALAFREYSFSYIYVTSMGGFVFLLPFFLLFSPETQSWQADRLAAGGTLRRRRAAGA